MRTTILLLVLASAGCTNWPKDAYVKNATIGATPWSPTMSVEIMATGKAAQNLTKEERDQILTPVKK